MIIYLNAETIEVKNESNSVRGVTWTLLAYAFVTDNGVDSLISMAASIHCIVVNLHPASLLLRGACVLRLRL